MRKNLMAALLISMLAVAPSAAAAAPAIPSSVFNADRSLPVFEVQTLLDRARQSPGVIDGRMGANTRRAILAYQRARGMQPTGSIDQALITRLRSEDPAPLLQTYTITAEDVAGPYRDVPSTMTGKAELDRAAFETPAEMLAEKFHMARAFLEALNPSADFGKAGTMITVARPGDDEQLGDVARIEVDKARNALRAYSAEGALLATYPTTVGSTVHPSPHETLQVLSVAPHPTYYFDPSGRDWGPDEALTIAAGPNNPVGVVWIDLSRDGYGIHGTPEPKLIGKSSSHGCVRLTNWDAHELSRAVAKGTIVEFL